MILVHKGRVNAVCKCQNHQYQCLKCGLIFDCCQSTRRIFMSRFKNNSSIVRTPSSLSTLISVSMILNLLDLRKFCAKEPVP